MRGPLPLSDADFAAVRANVLARIAQRRRAPWGGLAALAASVLVAVVSIVMAHQPIVMPRASHHPVVMPSVARDLGAREARRTPAQVPRYARHDTKKHHHSTTQLARIEIHTADPNIRIIWITRQEAP